MSYSTTAQIRDEAGFTNNTNITDLQIDPFREQAYSLVVSGISGVYNTIQLSGINFSGSTAELMLRRIEILLGAGYLLLDQYGNNDLGSGKTPFNWINQAEAMLARIINGDTRLIGNDGIEFERTNKHTSGGIGVSTSFNAGNTSKFSVDDCY